MSAGLPGLGLGGLLFIFSALLAPFRQLWRAMNGRSRPGDWPMVGRQFTQAVLMVAAIDLTLRLVYVGLSAAGLGDPPAANTGTVLPLNLIGITTALLAATLVAAKLAELALRLRRADFQRVPASLPRPALLRALAPGGTVTMVWFALLTGEAPELSSPPGPAEEAPRQRTGRQSPAGIAVETSRAGKGRSTGCRSEPEEQRPGGEQRGLRRRSTNTCAHA